MTVEPDHASEKLLGREKAVSLGKALQKLKPRILPKSNFGKAIRYTLGLWSRLGVYLQYGQVEIDNNLAENAIRPTAVGKKNWLFFGSPDSG